MPVDPSLVGRTFPPTRPYAVSEEKLREFADATGSAYDGGNAPATFPIVLAFEAMNAFLEAESVDLFRIVHGDQKFAYQRPIVAGDVLSATLTVAGLRQIAGNDIISTASVITDPGGAVVCTTSATLVHRGES
ncbi:MAG: MaoC family dehydratase N-terminal domain-containing protein [Actinomycetota bacterium]|nr:MaoC family dehydratase N-terminal domain-containing protein [Actinomycetota bacterium]